MEVWNRPGMAEASAKTVNLRGPATPRLSSLATVTSAILCRAAQRAPSRPDRSDDRLTLQRGWPERPWR
jgi:hypothetical protein